MSALIPKLTRVGLQAVFNASNSGLEANISHIALGDAGGNGYTPNEGQTQLHNERMRVAIGGGERVADHQIHMSTLFDTGPDFWIREAGIILEDGTLLAVWSDADTPLAYKTGTVPLVVAFDLALQGLPPDSINLTVNGPSVNILFAGPIINIGLSSVRQGATIINILRRQIINAINISEEATNGA